MARPRRGPAADTTASNEPRGIYSDPDRAAVPGPGHRGAGPGPDRRPWITQPDPDRPSDVLSGANPATVMEPLYPDRLGEDFLALTTPRDSPAPISAAAEPADLAAFTDAWAATRSPACWPPPRRGKAAGMDGPGGYGADRDRPPVAAHRRRPAVPVAARPPATGPAGWRCRLDLAGRHAWHRPHAAGSHRSPPPPAPAHRPRRRHRRLDRPPRRSPADHQQRSRRTRPHLPPTCVSG